MMINYSEQVKEKLSTYNKEDIIITNHAYLQAICREINIDEVKENIINPKRLSFARKEKAENNDEEKYDCYFGYSKTQCHRYILVINKKCVVCTIIKINRRWQYVFEKTKKI